jgi:hypothetical protein
MIEQLRYVIVLTTSKGEFFWNGNSKWDHQQTMGVNRTWGWVNDVRAAQHYHKAHAASLQAANLTVDVGRLFECEIGVKAVALRFDKGPLPAELGEVLP